MKKTLMSLLLFTVCSALLFPAVITGTGEVKDDLQDKIALSREGGTTRITSTDGMISSLSTSQPAVVEAHSSNNLVTVSIENYRGGAWVEIIGEGGAKQSYVEVYDMGFDVITLTGLMAGEYIIRITLGTEIYSGTFKKGQYGRR